MNRELLEKPFNPNQVKHREGSFGNMLDYIEGHAIIQRLNDAFEAKWSFTILEHRILKDTDEVLVLGQFKTGDIVKTQFGSSKIKRNINTDEVISLSSDLKASATDSLKKCATMLGVGLHLHGNDSVRAPESPHTPLETNTNVSGSGGRMSGCQGVQMPSNYKGNGNGLMSRKQRNYIKVLTDDIAMNLDELNGQCLHEFNTNFTNLSSKQASSLIQWLMPN